MLGETVEYTESFAAYDTAAKKLISNKIVLARIMQSCVSEYEGLTPDEIEQYIDGEPETSDSTEMIKGISNENLSVDEGNQYFDILFYATIPGSKDRIGLLINIEIQNDYYPGYSLVRRGIYYCCRLLSAQRGSIFSGDKYGQLKKVYSIWICTNAPDYRADTITRYKITEDCVKGNSTEPPVEYDLMNIILINFNSREKAEGINDILKVLLSNELSGMERKEILANKYEMRMTREMEGSVNGMCNLSMGVWRAGIEQGFSQGMEQGIMQGITQGMEQGIMKGVQQGIMQGIMENRSHMVQAILQGNLLSVETISQYAGIPVADVLAIQKEMEKNT